MKARTILLLIILCAQSVHSQIVNDSNEKQSTLFRLIHHEKIAFKLNYFDELGLYPGLEIGTDDTLAKQKWVTVCWDMGLGG